MRSDHDCGTPFDPKPDAKGSVGAERDERRADPRDPVDEPATLRVLNPLQSPARIPIRVLDISRGGMKLRLTQSLMPGTLVQIRFQGRLALGEVRHCEAVGEEYHAGVRLQDLLDTDLPKTA